MLILTSPERCVFRTPNGPNPYTASDITVTNIWTVVTQYVKKGLSEEKKAKISKTLKIKNNKLIDYAILNLCALERRVYKQI